MFNFALDLAIIIVETAYTCTHTHAHIHMHLQSARNWGKVLYESDSEHLLWYVYRPDNNANG